MKKYRALIIFVLFLFGNQFALELKQIKWSGEKLAEQYDKNNRVMDPNNYLTLDEKIVIQKLIKEIEEKKNVIAIIAFIDEIADTYLTYGGNKKEIKRFVDEFVKVITKGNPLEEDNTLVVVFSIKDRQVRIRPGRLVATSISVAQVNTILNDIKKPLASSKYGDAGSECLELLLKDLMNPPNRSTLSTAAILAIVIVSVLVTIFMTLMICFFCLNRRNNNAQRDEEGETKLYKIKELAKDQENAKQFYDETCLICLEELEKTKTDNDIPANNQEKSEIEKDTTVRLEQPSITLILECGHSFHRICIQNWIQKSNTRTCPTCRKNITLEEHIPGRDDKSGHKAICLEDSHANQTSATDNQHYNSRDMLESLVAIQLIMHPGLHLYSFSYTDGFDYSLPFSYDNYNVGNGYIGGSSNGFFSGGGDFVGSIGGGDFGASGDW